MLTVIILLADNIFLVNKRANHRIICQNTRNEKNIYILYDNVCFEWTAIYNQMVGSVDSGLDCGLSKNKPQIGQ